MKSLIVFLLVLGVYSTPCNDNEFRIGTACIPCAESYCKTCDGTSICKECPDGFKQDGRCNTCVSTDAFPIGKSCEACEKYGAKSEDGNHCVCDPNSDDTCCGDNSLFVARIDNENKCYSCSGWVVGCAECTYSQETDRITCKDCIKGYTLEGLDDQAVCFSFSAHLFAAAGLLISLLTLV